MDLTYHAETGCVVKSHLQYLVTETPFSAGLFPPAQKLLNVCRNIIVNYRQRRVSTIVLLSHCYYLSL